jgi:putative RecB family exonuclease
MPPNTLAPKKPFTLSPSRAKDYLQCQLLYKYKVIDKLPSPPSIEAVRGTHVHAILEDLFYLSSSERTLEMAQSKIWGKFEEVLKKSPSYDQDVPEISQIKAGGEVRESYEKEVKALLTNYFELETPSLLNKVVGQEMWVSSQLSDDLKIGGFIDRVEFTPGAGTRISDYKTGKKPGERFEDDALFQMYFYALVWKLTHDGEVPKQVKLLYLKDAGLIVREPTDDILDQMQVDVLKIWGDIKTSMENDSWEPKTSKLCDWCNFKDICPKFSTASPVASSAQ